MNRRFATALALARARLRRLATTLTRAVTTDEDVTQETHFADQAEAESLARAADELRGGVAKLGQLRAYFEDFAPLERLWDGVAAVDPAAIRGVIETDLGAAPESLFARFEEKPFAAASLGQVHAAEDAQGRQLAVKVQYPGIAEALAADLSGPVLVRRLVGGALGKEASPEALSVLRAQLLSELDYSLEAKSLARFAGVYQGDAEIAVPFVVPDRSSRRVLTMERLEGRNLPALRGAPDAERTRAARAIFRFAFGTPLLHGFFNADPHPGNYVVGDSRVGFVDFGSVATLDEPMRSAEHKLWLSLVHRDGEALRHAAHEEGLVVSATTFDGQTWRDFERALGAPFLKRDDHTLSPAHATGLVDATAHLLASRQAALSPAALVLWRQRLGAFRVLADLRPTLPFRRLLCDLLDDGRNPISLYDRYR